MRYEVIETDSNDVLCTYDTLREAIEVVAVLADHRIDASVRTINDDARRKL